MIEESELRRSNGSIGNEPHRMSSYNQGESQIEVLASRIETLRKNRIPVTMQIRRKFIDHLYKVSCKEGYKDHDRVHYEDLVAFREQIEKETMATLPLFKAMGFLDYQETWQEIFTRAETTLEEDDKANGWFFYRDFMVCVIFTRSICTCWSL